MEEQLDGLSTSATSSDRSDDMKTSARNVFKGRIVDVAKGATTAHVKIDIGGGLVVTSSITNASAEELKLAAGQDAYAIVKASDVMIGID
jgi:molybdopterin-binding protein